MAKIGFHASHEQFSPSELLHFVQLAEEAGFEFVLSSDHITPWSNSQHNGGFSFAWLGAALQATSMPYSVVCAPGYRYHPVVLAQAIATLAEMFPHRFFPCLGSGEALNEHVVGSQWPEKKERNQILFESVQVMKRLWQGETVSHQGHFTANHAKLYTLPPHEIPIYGAALSKETAAWLGEWADGLLTAASELKILEEKVNAFQKKSQVKKPFMLKADLSYDQNEQEAINGAYEQWRYTMVDAQLVTELPLPEDFEKASQKVTKEEITQKVKIVTQPKEAIEWIQKFVDMGFETIVLHNVNRKQEAFIQDFGKEVLSFFKS